MIHYPLDELFQHQSGSLQVVIPHDKFRRPLYSTKHYFVHKHSSRIPLMRNVRHRIAEFQCHAYVVLHLQTISDLFCLGEDCKPWVCTRSCSVWRKSICTDFMFIHSCIPALAACCAIATENKEQVDIGQIKQLLGGYLICPAMQSDETNTSPHNTAASNLSVESRFQKY